MFSLTYVSCNLCGLSKTRLVQKAETPFSVVQCKNCGLVYTNPQPAREEIEQHYQKFYYQPWLQKQLKRRILMWKKRLQQLKTYKQNGRLLDVGCGLGTFLKLAHEEGFEVCGTEISEYACRYIKSNLGLEVFKGELSEINLPDSYFDVITFWHSLEHMSDPKGNLEQAYRILKPQGLLVVATPNINNFVTRVLYLLARGRKLKLFTRKAKELHLYHFSEHTLTTLLEEVGFKVLSVQMDLAQIEFYKKIIDWLAVVFYLLTHRNFGEAFKIYAVKN